MNPVDEIFELFEQRGGADYGGERVSHSSTRCNAPLWPRRPAPMRR